MTFIFQGLCNMRTQWPLCWVHLYNLMQSSATALQKSHIFTKVCNVQFQSSWKWENSSLSLLFGSKLKALLYCTIFY